MKMPLKLQETVKTLRAACLHMPKRASADAYAQLDPFLTVNNTVQSGEQLKHGVRRKDCLHLRHACLNERADGNTI
ncbi:MAG: hypothetical protein JWO89_3161 [Verrucomicrobiaceae bacterium]|nr:hypothetical protein [Verrucomicrobiaceae bacterium]